MNLKILRELIKEILDEGDVGQVTVTRGSSRGGGGGWFSGLFEDESEEQEEDSEEE